MIGSEFRASRSTRKGDLKKRTMGSLGSIQAAPGSQEKWRLAVRLFTAESSPPDPNPHPMLALQNQAHVMYPLNVAGKTGFVLE